MEDAVTTKCGFAAVIGRPNVGKSTLLNKVLGQKLQIATDKPQTTRNRVLAVHNMGNDQVIFLDTPGLHEPRGSLGRYMVDAARSAIEEADVCAWLIDANDRDRKIGLLRREIELGQRLGETGLPILALLNKVDLLRDKTRLLPLLEELEAFDGIREVIPISALVGDGVDLFLAALRSHLPPGPKLYPEDMLSDRAERFFVAELVREALIDLTRQEIPYASAVVIDRFVEEPDQCLIHATIHVERTSQRGIVVGKGGSMIREIGTRARQGASEMLDCKVELRLHVEVTPGWSRSPEGLKKVGLE